jgi:autotransporter-associated beta strand protein
VTVSGGGGTGLQINTSLSSGVVQFLLVKPGSGYTSLPTLGLTGGAGGSGASISASAIGVVALNVSSFGGGYTSAPAISIDNSSWTSGATATATVPAATMTLATFVGGTGPLTIGLPVQGSFGLTKVGANTLTLSGANGFTGDTTVSAGTLRLGAAGVIPDGSGKGNVVMNPAADTATFDVNGQTETINGLSNSGAGASVVDNTSGSGSLTVGANNSAVTFTGVIQNSAGSLALTKTGSGTMTLSGANTHSGGTVISGGTVLAGVSSVTSGTTVTSGPFGTGNLTLNDGVTLASSSSAGRSIAAPVINIAGNITLGQPSGGTGRLSIDGTWDLGGSSRTVTLGKASSGYASGLEVFRFEQLAGFTTPTVHNGSLVLATTTGTTVTPSIARVLNTTSFSNNTALALGDGVALSSGNGVFFGTGANAPALTLSADAGRGGGVFQMGDGTSGGNAVVRVAEIYSLAGGGTVSAANSSGTTTTGTLTINNGGGAVFSGSITETGGTGKIALIKSGAGTQTFSGSLGHSGNTTISGGTLALTGSATISSTPVITLLSNATFDVAGLSSAFTLGAGQTLKGQGGVVGASVLNGSLEPGTSVGTLTFSAPPTLAGATVMEINQSTAPAADNVVVTTGTLNYGGVLIITNIGPVVTNATFTLFSASGYSGAFSSVTVPAGGTKHWLTNNLGVNGTVTFTNNKPVANALTTGVALGGSVALQVIGGKHSATDADGDVLTVTAVGTPTSGGASFASSNITYIASGDLGTNTFTYTITDEVGATSSNTVTVLVSNPQGFNQVAAGVDGGNAVLTYLGIPGTNYALEITHELPATNWVPVITNPASANGFLYFTNPISLTPTNDYYRTRFVP